LRRQQQQAGVGACFSSAANQNDVAPCSKGGRAVDDRVDLGPKYTTSRHQRSHGSFFLQCIENPESTLFTSLLRFSSVIK
jgi:hypothetical protein